MKAPRLRACGRTFDGRTYRKRGDHLCKPRADHAIAFAQERAGDLRPHQRPAGQDLVHPRALAARRHRQTAVR